MKRNLLLLACLIAGFSLVSAASIDIYEGWNLVPFGFENSVSNRSCVSNFATVPYFYDPSTNTYFPGSFENGMAYANRTEEGQEVLSKYSSFLGKFLTPGKTGTSFWVNSAANCRINTGDNFNTPAASNELFIGWNFLALTKQMAGKKLSDVLKGCEADTVIVYDTRNKNWSSYTDSQVSMNDVGKAVVVQASVRCKLALEPNPVLQIPELPANPRPVKKASVENTAPTISTIPNKEIAAASTGVEIDLHKFVSDKDEDNYKLNYFYNSSDTGLVNCKFINIGILSCFKVSPDKTGEAEIRVVVNDSGGKIADKTFTIKVLGSGTSVQKSGLPQTNDGTYTINVGDKIQGLNGINVFEGKKLYLKLKRVYKDFTGVYFAEFELYDADNNLKDLRTVPRNWNIAEQFKDSEEDASNVVLTSQINVTAIGENPDGEKFVTFNRVNTPTTPVITKVNPLVGGDGIMVSVSGINFTPENNSFALYKDGVNVQIGSASSTDGKTTTVFIAAGKANGVYKILITNSNGTSNEAWYQIRK